MQLITKKLIIQILICVHFEFVDAKIFFYAMNKLNVIIYEILFIDVVVLT